LDWGIAIAVLLFIVKTAIDFFKEKDKSESALMDSLISDLRTEGQQLREAQAATLSKMSNLQEQQLASLSKISESLKSLSIVEQQQKRDFAVLAMQQRDLRDQIVILGEQIKALHGRMDKNHLPPSHD
jgi:FtsZ-binding cell division protein ZapB